MPVSKNKRKNQKNVDLRAQKRAQRLKKENSGLAVLGRALSQFNQIRENVRKLASMYVSLTKSIPGYQETNPDVMPGLQKAIPALQEVNAQYDRLAKAAAEMAKNPPKNDLEYMPLMAEFENMYVRFSDEFITNFLPVIDSIERLGEEHKAVDLELVKETREAMAAVKPQFETKVD